MTMKVTMADPVTDLPLIAAFENLATSNALPTLQLLSCVSTLSGVAIPLPHAQVSNTASSAAEGIFRFVQIQRVEPITKEQ